MAEYHKIAGQLGGRATVGLYGSEHMSTIGRLGGRPRWQETLERYQQQNKQALKKARHNN